MLKTYLVHVGPDFFVVFYSLRIFSTSSTNSCKKSARAHGLATFHNIWSANWRWLLVIWLCFCHHCHHKNSYFLLGKWGCCVALGAGVVFGVNRHRSVYRHWKITIFVSSKHRALYITHLRSANAIHCSTMLPGLHRIKIHRRFLSTAVFCLHNQPVQLSRKWVLQYFLHLLHSTRRKHCKLCGLRRLAYWHCRQHNN